MPRPLCRNCCNQLSPIDCRKQGKVAAADALNLFGFSYTVPQPPIPFMAQAFSVVIARRGLSDWGPSTVHFRQNPDPDSQTHAQEIRMTNEARKALQLTERAAYLW